MFEQIAREVIAETKAADEAEDEIHGDQRGDELPEELRTPEGRRESSSARLDTGRGQARGEDVSEQIEEPQQAPAGEVPLELDAARPWRAPKDGRGGCGRASASSSSVVGMTRIRSLARGLSGCCWRPSGWRQIWIWSAAPTRPIRRIGRKGGCATAAVRRPAQPYTPPELPAGKVNVTDPDSRPIPIGFGFVQGYDAQAAVNEQQIVLVAEITNNSTDFSQLAPIVNAVLA
jgi:hypothetical protein